jgi:hypothetical protein
VENICSINSQKEDRLHLSKGANLLNETSFSNFESLQLPFHNIALVEMLISSIGWQCVDKANFLTSAWEVYMAYGLTEST